MTLDCIQNTTASASYAPVILMVSGGADSVALLLMAVDGVALDICDGAGKTPIDKQRLVVFHLNHQLRGQDAEDDEAFVKNLCQQFAIPCYSVKAPIRELALELGDSNIENVAREVRYREVYALADKLAAKVGVSPDIVRILTAHSANDKAETYLMNSVRGATLAGLASMPRRAGSLVRPLLHYTHEELEAYVLSRGLSWRIDATNKDTHYLRSFIRYEVLPVLKQKNPQVVSTIARNADLLEEENSFIQKLACELYDRALLEVFKDDLAFDVNMLSGADKVLVKRVIKRAIEMLSQDVRLEQQHIDAALEVLAGTKDSITLATDIQVRRQFGKLYFFRSCDTVAGSVVLSIPGEVRFGNYLIEASFIKADELNGDPTKLARECFATSEGKVVLMDASFCDNNPCLLVESFKSGDSFSPLGMEGKHKKVADLFANSHIPAHRKKNIPLIWDNEHHNIVYVGGIRMAEHVKCRKTTQKFLQLKFKQIVMKG